MKHRLVFWLVILFGLSWVAAAEPPTIAITLDQAVTQALAVSSKLKAKRLELAAAQARRDAQSAGLWPRLSLDASWRYLSVVPSVPAGILSARQPEIPLGDHTNYSVGPMLTWNFWDSGGMYFNLQAADNGVQAKQAEVTSLVRQITLQTHMSYFQVQWVLAQVRLLTDALKLSRAQYQDIGAQNRAGQTSRIDLLTSHQETLNNQRQLRQARTELSGALREFFNLIGGGEGLDFSYPVAYTGQPVAAGEPQPTLLLQLDPLAQSLTHLDSAATAMLDPELPQVRLFYYLSEANQRLAQSLAMGHWPKVLASAKTSLDYPNGPSLETINQNTFSVAASWSLWEGGRIVQQSQEQQFNAQASDEQQKQVWKDMTLSWQKSRDQLAQLRDTVAIDAEAVRETETLSQLVYQAYRSGRAGFLEVQSANYRGLAAKIQAVRTQVQMLIQLATLKSLSKETQP